MANEPNVYKHAEFYVPAPEARRVWSTDEEHRAHREGWGLVLLRNGKAKIVKRRRPAKRDKRIRARDVFETDAEARVFVEQQVEKNDPLACKAIAILARWTLTQGNV